MRQHQHQHQQQHPNQLRINVPLDQLTPVICRCGGQLFDNGVMLRMLSALQSPIGQPAVIEIPIRVCVSCGMPYNQESAVNASFEDGKYILRSPQELVLDLQKKIAKQAAAAQTAATKQPADISLEIKGNLS